MTADETRRTIPPEFAASHSEFRMSALGKPTPGGVMPPAQSSMRQNTSINDGSPPGMGAKVGSARVLIETSAPADPHTLGRAPSGWLK